MSQGGLAAAWRDFRTWPRSARRTTVGLLILIGMFLPAACGDAGEVDETRESSTTTMPPATSEPTLLTTTQPPPTTAAPTTTTQAPPPTTAATRSTTPTTSGPSSGSAGATYANCSEAEAAGAAPISRGEPGYSSRLDRDNDGIACEG